MNEARIHEWNDAKGFMGVNWYCMACGERRSNDTELSICPVLTDPEGHLKEILKAIPQD